MNSIALAALVAGFVCGMMANAQDSDGPPPGKSVPGKRYKNVGVADFDKFRADTNSVVLDVRTPKEFAAGHVPGAVHIDWYAADFDQKVGELDKGKTYLVHCAAGGRSAKACEKMTGKLGFAACYNLEGGFKAWERTGKPVQK